MIVSMFTIFCQWAVRFVGVVRLRWPCIRRTSVVSTAEANDEAVGSHQSTCAGGGLSRCWAVSPT